MSPFRLAPLAAALLPLALPALAQLSHPAAPSLGPFCHGQRNHKCRVTPPPPPPVTLSITFDPPNPSIPDDSTAGTLLANVIVTVSDGSAFTGSLGFAPPFGSDNGFCALQGRQVLLGGPLMPGASVQICTIAASQ